MDKYAIVKGQLAEVEERIGYIFKDKVLLLECFTHGSYSNETKVNSYERLEFLGDSVLDMLIAKKLYFTKPNLSEGVMTQLRANIVSAKPLSLIFDALKLQKFIITSEGSIVDEAVSSENVKSDIVESIIAGMYLDGGIEIAEAFILKNIALCDVPTDEDDINPNLAKDYKSMLYEHAAKRNLKVRFASIEIDKNQTKEICVTLFINGEKKITLNAAKKKEAEKLCAKEYLEKENVNI